MTPRVLVAVPTRGCAHAPSLLRASALARRFGHEVMLEIGRPIDLVRARLVTRFLGTSADWLLTIDDDISAPDEALDRLLALAAPVATAPCPIAIDGRIVANVKRVGSDAWVETPPAEVFAVRQTGLGFTLVQREVFARIRQPWFQFGAAGEGRTIGEDTWFSNRVTAAGLSILCDGSLPCSHYKDGLDLLALARWGR